jgi:DNA polymerase I
MVKTMSRYPKCFLIDAMAIAYRSHFAMIHNPLVTSDGRHVSAAFGFVRQILKIIKDEKPDYLAVVFDSKEKTFRHKMFEPYKATREKMPDELKPQINWIKELLDAMNIPVLMLDGYEADDIIGTMALAGEKAGFQVYMVTGDKDFMQLVTEQITMYAPAAGKKETALIGPAEVKAKWGVEPRQIIDFLALMGDSSDNVPGVPGVGEKTAAKLLQSYQSLENIFENAEEQRNARVRDALLENRQQAELSRKLVTIDCQVPIDYKWEDIARQDFNYEKLKPLLENLEFHTIFKELAIETNDKKPTQNYQLIDTLEKLSDLCNTLLKQDIIAIDTETTSTEAMNARLVGISIAWKAWQAVYIPIRFPEKGANIFGDDDEKAALDLLRPVLENPKIKKSGQNIKYDALVLRRAGVKLKGIVFDTMIADYLLNPDNNSHKLDLLAQRYLHYQMQPIEDLIGKGKKQITMDLVPVKQAAFYAAEDADITFQLSGILKKKLEDGSLLELMEKIEVPLINCLIEMEYNGLYIDTAFLQDMSAELQGKINAMIREIHSLAGETFNINSPAQLGNILFEKLKLPVIRKTKTGFSTDINVLEELKDKHPLPEKVLEYRQLTKLLSTYVDALPQLKHLETERVHSSFNQTVAATGRLSSNNPNFQNIPIRTETGRLIRRAFIPQKTGWKILAADYSQVELRIMAHLSGDPKLMQAFLDDADVHARTAALVFGVPHDKVTTDMRRTAKVVNFGIMYGAGPFRISNELNLSRAEAQGIIKAYFDTYAGIRKYIDETLVFCRKNRYVETLSGRRRWVNDINSENRNLREAAERIAINMPVQGSAADLIKIAMINIHNILQDEKLQTKMISQVHDELVFELPDEELETVKIIIRREMEQAMKLDVPLKVDLGIGESWFDAH